MVKVFFEKFLIIELVFIFPAHMERCIVRTKSIHMCVCWLVLIREQSGWNSQNNYILPNVLEDWFGVCFVCSHLLEFANSPSITCVGAVQGDSKFILHTTSSTMHKASFRN